ncbi:MAG: TetR/AcrR family transcriptional regulator [Acidobacteriota bacterium]
MPWEKSFDTDQALAKAMQVFWSKGYDSTSMTNLTQAMGINKGSLYNAFGGKRALFIKSIVKYDFENRRQILSQLEALDDPIRAFGMFFEVLISESVGDSEKKGCFLINTSLELPRHDEETRTLVTEALKDLEAFFRRGLEAAGARGDVDASLDAAVTAKALVALVVGLRVLARGTYDESGLRAIKAQALVLLGRSDWPSTAP